MRLCLIPMLMFLSSCSCFKSCRCTPEIEENKILVTPPELRTSATPATQTDATTDQEGN